MPLRSGRASASMIEKLVVATWLSIAEGTVQTIARAAVEGGVIGAKHGRKSVADTFPASSEVFRSAAPPGVYCCAVGPPTEHPAQEILVLLVRHELLVLPPLAERTATFRRELLRCAVQWRIECEDTPSPSATKLSEVLRAAHGVEIAAVTTRVPTPRHIADEKRLARAAESADSSSPELDGAALSAVEALVSASTSPGFSSSTSIDPERATSGSPRAVDFEARPLAAESGRRHAAVGHEPSGSLTAMLSPRIAAAAACSVDARFQALLSAEPLDLASAARPDQRRLCSPPRSSDVRRLQCTGKLPLEAPPLLLELAEHGFLHRDVPVTAAFDRVARGQRRPTYQIIIMVIGTLLESGIMFMSRSLDVEFTTGVNTPILDTTGSKAPEEVLLFRRTPNDAASAVLHLLRKVHRAAPTDRSTTLGKARSQNCTTSSTRILRRTAGIFRSSMQVRGRVLAHISAGMRTMLASDNITDKIMALTQMHRRFGVKLEHYDCVGRGLIHDMERTSGDNWSPEIDDAWRRMFSHSSVILIRMQRRDEKQNARAFAHLAKEKERLSIGGVGSVLVAKPAGFPPDLRSKLSKVFSLRFSTAYSSTASRVEKSAKYTMRSTRERGSVVHPGAHSLGTLKAVGGQFTDLREQ
ncbi:hypothetical protein ON010_g10556 [Phytophthora cinnamomi]|nr:hypothetical protein ON010_g10556 [Phytophthora cinnamomi]